MHASRPQNRQAVHSLAWERTQSDPSSDLSTAKVLLDGLDSSLRWNDEFEFVAKTMMAATQSHHTNPSSQDSSFQSDPASTIASTP